MRRYACILGLLLGCSREAPEPIVPVHEVATPKPAPPVTSPAKVLFRIEAVIDGTLEVVTLTDDGTLRIGPLATRIELARNEYFFAKQASLRFVEIDATHAGILFAAPTEESEDPPNRYRLFVKKKGTIHVALDRVIGTYGVTELAFSKTFGARYVEDAWSACDRTKYPIVAASDEVTFALDAALDLVEVARRTTKTVHRCRELSG